MTMSSDSTTTGENIRPQISSGDAVVSRSLDERPPLRIEKDLVVDPIRNRLLADGVVPSLPNQDGKSGLAAGELNSPIEGDNVRFLHKHGPYTRILVDVNKFDCLTSNKEPCTVLSMPTPKKKVQPKPKPTRKKQDLTVGPDGLTMPARLESLMRSAELGQTQLARECSQYYQRFMPKVEGKVQQQHIFNILKGQASAECLPLLAIRFDVNELWLQFGIGPKSRSDRI